MKFKLDHMQAQLDSCPAKLQEIALYADHVARAQFGKDIVITRVKDGFPGESGVHLVGRAFDVRVEYATGHGDETRWYFTKDQAAKLAELINQQYPRKDKKLTCLLHEVEGSLFHLHVQIPAHWAQEVV